LHSFSQGLTVLETYPSWPVYAEDEIAAVLRVLKCGKVNYWTGEECRLFEREYAAASGCAHAVAVMNGTVALELALHALEIPAGAEVITSPRTFIASASCIVAHGCVPVLAEVDPDSGNITAESIAQVITPRTRAVVVVHLAGWPCDMDPILELAAMHGLKVIEDCAQANGATYKGRPVGSLGHAAAFSFCQDKIITTGGEGGMLTTCDEAVWRRAWEYKDHGKSWDAVYKRTHGPGFRWLHESFGTNWRMTEMQAAIGRIQLKQLASWTERRTRIANRIAESLAPFGQAVRVPRPSSNIRHAYYRQYAYVRPTGLREGWNRDRIVAEAREAGIPLLHGSCSEVYLEKAFDNTDFRPRERLPVARELGETSLMFLVHPTLTDAEVDRVCSTMEEIFSRAAR